MALPEALPLARVRSLETDALPRDSVREKDGVQHGRFTHTDCPGPFVIMSRAHLVQRVVSEALEIVLTVQFVHCVDPLSAANVPAGHVPQVTEPRSGAALPATQYEQ